jgi:hypothetical protein
MERQAVKSSNIKSVGYDAEAQALEVEFNNGSLFQYEGVEPREYVAMLNSESVGKFLNTAIKPNHNVSKVEPKKEEACND